MIFLLALLLASLSVSYAQTPTTADDGATLYRERCASCHGPSGRGESDVAAYLNPRPRDFTSGRYKFRSTETGSLPTDEDIAYSITEGLHGTAMPAWKPFLAREQVRALVAHIKSLSPRFATEQPQPIRMAVEMPSSPENIQAGRAVYDKLRCAACHGTDGRGTGAIAQELKDDWGQPTEAISLVEPWAFRGGNNVRDIYLRFRTGMNGTPMPSFLGAATDSELWQLAVYVKSIGRRPLWELKGEEVAAFYREKEQEAATDLVRHGEYIATISGCALCHSHTTPGPEGPRYKDMYLAGGFKMTRKGYGTYVSMNLTPDRETGLGSYTDADIKRVLRSGVSKDGSRVPGHVMPWPFFSNWTDEDLHAVVVYLRHTTPIVHKIPAPSDAILTDPAAFEEDYGGKDYAAPQP